MPTSSSLYDNNNNNNNNNDNNNNNINSKCYTIVISISKSRMIFHETNKRSKNNIKGNYSKRLE